MNLAATDLAATDLAILIAYLVGMVLFGVWMGRRQKNAADFMVGGRDFPWWVILFSIVATETSTVTFLSVPGVAWSGNLAFLQLPLGYIIGRMVVVGLLLPRYFRGQMFTAYEVLDQRFGGHVKKVASLLFIVTRTLGDGMRLFLSAYVLQVVAGIDMNLAVVCLGVATIFYTFTGGMRAVLWTDAVQFLVYMVGAGVAMAMLLDGIDGGWGGVTSLVGEEIHGAGAKLEWLDFGFDLSEPLLFWTGLIGGAVFAVGTHGVDQMLVQRYLCARNQRQASLALALSGPVVFLQFAFFLVIGTALYAFYWQQGDTAMGQYLHQQVASGEPIKEGDRVFATFIVDTLPVGVLGIVLGAVFSAAMSTLSSSLNSASTALVNDILYSKSAASSEPDGDVTRLRAAKLFTVVFGIAQIVVGVSGQWMERSIVSSVLAVQGFTTGIILGVFFLGMFTRSVGQRAALVGLIGGLVVMSGVKFGTPLAWPWFALVGSSATFGIGLLAAKLLPESPEVSRA